MGTPRSFGDYPPVMNSHQVADMVGLPVKAVQKPPRQDILEDDP